MTKGKMKRSKKIKSSVIILITGLVMIAYCKRGIFKAKASTSWPSTKGEIISSEVERPIFGLSKGKNKDCIFKARYQYTIDGEVYISERVSFLSKYISKEKKLDIENKYAIGNTIDIFYNPDAPNEATLIIGVNKYNKNP